jgi:UDP-N-acetylglucosamine acyltransferase
MPIDPSAIIHPGAEIAEDVSIGKHTVIDEHVKIGRGTRIGHVCYITGNTTIGENNKIYSHVVLGTDPQDLKFKGEITELHIGNDNTFREFVTVNVGTAGGGGKTVIGNRNHIMACVHVAHDCHLDDNIIIANAVLLAGHVHVESNVVFGGAAAVHHYATIGRMAMVGGLTRVVQDVAPFMITEGDRQIPRGVNVVGCRRNGLTDPEVEALEEAYKIIYRSRLSRAQAFERLESNPNLTVHVKTLIDFLRRMAMGKKGRYLQK